MPLVISSTTDGRKRDSNLLHINYYQLDDLQLCFALPLLLIPIIHLLRPYLNVVDHTDLDQADVGDIESNRGAPAVFPQERVPHIDHELLQIRRRPPGLHI